MVELDEFLFKQFHDSVRLGISQELKEQKVELPAHPICVKIIVAYINNHAGQFGMSEFLEQEELVKQSYVTLYGFGESDTDISVALSAMQKRVADIEKVVISYVKKGTE
ncbi:TPA: hypothetical protein JG825_003434 [Vibrio parahaemolyticus]|uniref:hypothetical protein n=1 Tax=Vibrio harveyi group TaxID=717610 RepID=UPI0018F2114B|nr:MULTISPECIES: hypothetical protein [Vibrio harveyi group]MCR9909639.1 hypothetical protein [Vibrio campbellii]UPR19103.1 hypothetical protein H9J99_26010 [Vibrio parahaemolyticus]HAV1520115.1 hypothetical protein [Vibrio parahaemolyticus]HAV1539082.1 hypothetical protein [Vibrio parahaemolyticus]